MRNLTGKERIYGSSLMLPQHAVMSGYRIGNDIVPAKAIGMKTIWVKQDFGKYWKKAAECGQAAYEVNSLSELLEIKETNFPDKNGIMWESRKEIHGGQYGAER
ncbi:MAG: hypothetical protein HFH91_19380 [Lachnospiraceae bacterium]|nr:hypothetical protein [Lachnospiraceae bacterium]